MVKKAIGNGKWAMFKTGICVFILQAISAITTHAGIFPNAKQLHQNQVFQILLIAIKKEDADMRWHNSKCKCIAILTLANATLYAPNFIFHNSGFPTICNFVCSLFQWDFQ
jgi:hypothetical protein